VRVSPGARASRVLGVHGDALKVSVSAPPEKGRANAALLELLARELEVPKSRLSVCSGSLSRDKVVRIEGLSPAEVAARLLLILGRP
jgi:hypothetical protein